MYNGTAEWWLVLVAPAAALFGVALSQVITFLTERSRRESEHAKDAREAAEKLMEGLFAFRRFVLAAHSVRKHDADSVFEEEWATAGATLVMQAALLTGGGGHRQNINILLDGINSCHLLAREGLGVTDSTRGDYLAMATGAFETAAAWLRYERVPRSSRWVARSVRRAMYWLRLEWRSRDHQESTGKELRSGIVRRAWRVFARWTRKLFATLMAPAIRVIGFLFRP